METDRSRAQTSHSDMCDPIGHMQQFLAPVQLAVTRPARCCACVTQCAVPGVTSAQAPVMYTRKSKGLGNSTRSRRQVGLKLEGEIWS